MNCREITVVCMPSKIHPQNDGKLKSVLPAHSLKLCTELMDLGFRVDFRDYQVNRQFKGQVDVEEIAEFCRDPGPLLLFSNLYG